MSMPTLPVDEIKQILIMKKWHFTYGILKVYAGCIVLCCSKLQTRISLSTIEAEYTTLIQVMLKVIPFMALMKALSFIFNIHLPKPEFFYWVFKDNKSYISIVESNKLSPRNKYIAIKYHHFRSFVQRKIIYICYIDTRKQTEETFTHPLTKSLFIYFWRNLSRWWLKKWNLCFYMKESYNTENKSKSHFSQLIQLNWKFVFWNASEKVLVSLKHIIHILIVFINWTYGFWFVWSDPS